MARERLPWDEAMERADLDRLANLQDFAREAQSRAAQEAGYNSPPFGDDGGRPTASGDALFARSNGGHAGQDSGEHGEGLRANFDASAAERLAAAKAANADYQDRFNNPTIKAVLADNGFAGKFKMPAGAVPSHVVVPGGKGFETVNSFLAASGGGPEALQAIENAAARTLTGAMRPAGDLAPSMLAQWKQRYEGSLRAIDAISPRFSSRFDDAAKATQAVLDIGVQRKTAIADAQRQAARQAVIDNIGRRQALGEATNADRSRVNALLAERAATDRSAQAASASNTAAGIAQARGLMSAARTSPAGRFAALGGSAIASTEVENTVGAMLKTGTGGATRMRSLVSDVSSDPAALAGLRKAGVDYILRTFKNADGNLSGAKFIDFLRANRQTLLELYPHDQVATFGAVARDLEANAKWRTETTIKGGSDTAKNIKPMLEKAVDETKRHVSLLSAATAGFLADGIRGASAGAGLYLLNTLRSAGIRSVDDLYREALADSEVGRRLMTKMPNDVDIGPLRALSGLLRRNLIVGSQQVGAQNQGR